MYQFPQPFVPVFDWQDLIEPGDIVLFRFPINEDGEAAWTCRVFVPPQVLV